MTVKLVGVDEKGRRVCEDHPSAKLTRWDVARVFELRDDGMAVAEIARKMEVSRNTIRKIIAGLTWAEEPVRYKPVAPDEG